MSYCGPSFLKTYLYAACNVTLIHDECAVETYYKPKPKINKYPKKNQIFATELNFFVCIH